ncbi:MAG: hypothetical protein AB1629_00850 [Candidatus Omnitrophota bacterium]
MKNRLEEFKEQDNAVKVSDESCKSSSIATVAVLEKDFPYDLRIDNVAWELQPCRVERANYGRQLFILNRTYRSNVYRFFIDKKGLDEITIFSSSSSPEIIELNPVPLAVSTTWTGNFIETEVSNRVELGLRTIIERLKKFAELDPNWDSYDAESIEWDTISRAIDFFTRVVVMLTKENKRNSPVPFVAPVSDGSIQFEWRTFYKELIITIPKQVGDKLGYYKAEKDIVFGEVEESGNTSNIEDVIELAKDWLLS